MALFHKCTAMKVLLIVAITNLKTYQISISFWQGKFHTKVHKQMYIKQQQSLLLHIFDSATYKWQGSMHEKLLTRVRVTITVLWRHNRPPRRVQATKRQTTRLCVAVTINGIISIQKNIVRKHLEKLLNNHKNRLCFLLFYALWSRVTLSPWHGLHVARNMSWTLWHPSACRGRQPKWGTG